MGLLYKQQGKLERAVDAYERCLRVREKIMGAAHPDSIATRHNLAELYTVWAKPEKAREFLEENLKYMDELKAKHKKAQDEHSHSHEHSHDGEKCNDPTHNH
jgi:tetratricopeptide (TPR) repeat protein